MPSRLPDNYKSLAIQGWLNGEQRDKIAVDNGLSAGSVTNIVNEWRADLGLPSANALRELGVTLRRVGITPAQCALGFRTATLMHRIGVNEENFDSFIVDVYNRCKDIGLPPQNIAFHLADLLQFSKTVPLSKIPDYVKEKTTEKGNLEEEIEKLKAEIETLQEQKEDAQLVRDMALEDARITIFRLNWYTSIREDLGKYGISVDDTPKLAKLVNSLKQYEYDVDKVIKEFSDLENLTLRYHNLQDIIPSLENRKEELKRECSELQTWIAVHNQLLSKYRDLETMGFGLNKLMFLWTTVREIARENNLPLEEAVTKFLSDVERQYNNKLAFESKVESLRNEVNKLNQEQARFRSGLLLSPLVGPKLVKLTQNGISEQDIIN
ncbi:MAG TPA: hypothetical protein VEH06_11120, partial [Candidatus Bathyarchaeia archaeon]|nr:hypothetical protein [Candidatus Bathyarchaeia archaeon]